MAKKYETCFRLNPEDTNAKHYRLSKTAYLRRLIISEAVKEAPSQEVKLLRTEIYQIGNNINHFPI